MSKKKQTKFAYFLLVKIEAIDKLQMLQN